MTDQPKLFIEEALKPLDNYPGRKAAAGAWQKIISEIPKCELFIDAMCGSSFIASTVKGCHRIINDINRSIIDKIAYTAADTTFENRDYREVIKRYDNGSPGRVFYFDPPYLMETRSYKRPIYKYEWNDKDHSDFIKIMQGMQCPTLISHYPCPLYDRAFKRWRKISYNSMTRAGVRVENLYMNFPQPVLLQCFEHIGDNFTDRQRIKRKVQRHIARLQKEDPQERAAILSSIIAEFDYVISARKLQA